MTLPTALVLDTNCLIYYLDQPDSRRGAWLDEHVFRPAVAGRLDLSLPTVALAELLVRPYADGQPVRAERLRRALEMLPGLTITPLTVDVAVLAAQLRGRGSLGLADAVMAATASQLNATLLTNDQRLAGADTPAPTLLLDAAVDQGN